MASMLVDMPSKIFTGIVVNLIMYFMTNLRREAGPFFIFFLFSITCTIAMRYAVFFLHLRLILTSVDSMIFRTMASSTRTLAQAMPGASLMILAMVIYTGFVIPTRDMKPWFRWLNYLNPIAYAFEGTFLPNSSALSLTWHSSSGQRV